MKAELEQWLKGLELTDEDLKILGPALENEKIAAKMTKGVLLNSEFTAKMEALQAKEAEAKETLEDELAKTHTFYKETADWKKGVDAGAKENTTKLQKAEEKLAAIRTRMGTLKTSYGIEDSDLSGLFEEGTAPVKETEKTADPQYLARKDFDETVNIVKTEFPMIPAKLISIASRHAKIFGEKVAFDPEALVQEALKGRMSLEDAWQKKYDVPKRQGEIQEEGVQARIKTAVQEAETRVRSEQSNPAAPTQRPVSPVLEAIVSKRKEAPNNGGVMAAVTAYNEHKFGSQKVQ